MSKKSNRRPSTVTPPLWGKRQTLVERIKDVLILVSGMVLVATNIATCAEKVVDTVREKAPAVNTVPVEMPVPATPAGVPAPAVAQPTAPQLPASTS